MSSADTPAARQRASWSNAHVLRNDGVGSTPSEAFHLLPPKQDDFYLTLTMTLPFERPFST